MHSGLLFFPTANTRNSLFPAPLSAVTNWRNKKKELLGNLDLSKPLQIKSVLYGKDLRAIIGRMEIATAVETVGRRNLTGHRKLKAEGLPVMDGGAIRRC